MLCRVNTRASPWLCSSAVVPHQSVFSHGFRAATALASPPLSRSSLSRVGSSPAGAPLLNRLVSSIGTAICKSLLRPLCLRRPASLLLKCLRGGRLTPPPSHNEPVAPRAAFVDPPRCFCREPAGAPSCQLRCPNCCCALCRVAPLHAPSVQLALLYKPLRAQVLRFSAAFEHLCSTKTRRLQARDH